MTDPAADVDTLAEDAGPEPVLPGPDGLPRPIDAMAVAFDQRFVRAVSVALMWVVLNEPPNIGEPGQNMCRYIVGNPEEQARRFAVALASDPAVVIAALATNDNPGEVAGGLSVIAAKVRAMWPIMAGETGNPGGVEGPGTGSGPLPGKGGG